MTTKNEMRRGYHPVKLDAPTEIVHFSNNYEHTWNGALMELSR